MNESFKLSKEVISFIHNQNKKHNFCKYNIYELETSQITTIHSKIYIFKKSTVNLFVVKIPFEENKADIEYKNYILFNKNNNSDLIKLLKPYQNNYEFNIHLSSFFIIFHKYHNIHLLIMSYIAYKTVGDLVKNDNSVLHNFGMAIASINIQHFSIKNELPTKDIKYFNSHIKRSLETINFFNNNLIKKKSFSIDLNKVHLKWNEHLKNLKISQKFHFGCCHGDVNLFNFFYKNEKSQFYITPIDMSRFSLQAPICSEYFSAIYNIYKLGVQLKYTDSKILSLVDCFSEGYKNYIDINKLNEYEIRFYRYSWLVMTIIYYMNFLNVNNRDLIEHLLNKALYNDNIDLHFI